jgi:hypothetical protein
MMRITDGTLSSATDRSLVSVLSNLLRDATVGGAGQPTARRRRSVVTRPPVVVRPSWGIALGIASSATVLVMAMGLLSVLGAVALVMLG